MLMVATHVADTHSEGIGQLERRVLPLSEPIPVHALWIDLIEPTREEDRKVEKFLSVSIPTREEMSDIEPSETLYSEGVARYMSARLFYHVDDEMADIAGITFILTDKALVTVRYVEPLSFQMFVNRAGRPNGCGDTPEAVMAGLFETIMDRGADVLQAAGAQIDRLSRNVFADTVDPSVRNAGYQSTLRALGRYADLISKVRESLVSVERILLFLSASYRTARVPLEMRERVKTTLRDVTSLEEHASFLNNKIQFLLDATLGLVNLEQNNIIKLFSVMAVVFMPPTLIASIYGMNFKFIPELEWSFGYPMAVLMMVGAAVFPYAFFRWKKWL